MRPLQDDVVTRAGCWFSQWMKSAMGASIEPLGLLSNEVRIWRFRAQNSAWVAMPNNLVAWAEDRTLEKQRASANYYEV